jgi:hypothetical protein
MRMNFALILMVLGFHNPMSMIALSMDKEAIRYPTSYLYPVDDDRVIPLPYVSLRGKLIRHTFAGVPNYESIENGDYPETRWVLEIPQTEVRRLIDCNYLTKELYFPDEEGWVQVIAAQNEKDLQPLLNKQVVVQGYLGTLVSHIHTPAALEAKEIYEDMQKMD